MSGERYFITPCFNAFYLSHHGIDQMHWGIRRGPPYPLKRTSSGSLNTKAQLAAKKKAREQERIERKDLKWIKKNEHKLYTRAEKKSHRALKAYEKELIKTVNKTLKNGDVSKQYINLYNEKMVELMNTNIGDVPAPSGRIVRFIAKRGEIGVHTALVDPNYDLSKLKRGVYDSGRVAYKKEQVHMAKYPSK